MSVWTDHPELLARVRALRAAAKPPPTWARIAKAIKVKTGVSLTVNQIVGKIDAVERAETRRQMRGHGRPRHAVRRVRGLGS